MRGKLATWRAAYFKATPASMRPAHYAREVKQLASRVVDLVVASMRPAHYAREVPLARIIVVRPGDASMRPAHYAREVVYGSSK